MANPIYEEHQPIYLVLAIFGPLAVSFPFLGIFGKFENELVRLLVLILTLLFSEIILISYQFKSTVTADELILGFGNGFLTCIIHKSMKSVYYQQVNPQLKFFFRHGH